MKHVRTPIKMWKIQTEEFVITVFSSFRS